MHKVQLDRERSLVFDFAALRKIENITGASFLTGNPGNVPTDSLEWLLVALWAGLLRDDPALTLTQVEAMLSLENIAAVDAAVGAALSECLGKALGAKETAESPSTGSPSGQSESTTSA